MWVEAVPPTGHELADPRVASNILMQLPADATAVKMTWDPAVDGTDGGTYLRVYGHIDPPRRPARGGRYYAALRLAACGL